MSPFAPGNSVFGTGSYGPGSSNPTAPQKTGADQQRQPDAQEQQRPRLGDLLLRLRLRETGRIAEYRAAGGNLEAVGREDGVEVGPGVGQGEADGAHREVEHRVGVQN